MSQLFEGFLSTPELLSAWGEREFVAAMLRFEAALAHAQGEMGVIPPESAQSIAGTCKVELFDVARIVRDSQRAGCLASPLVKALQDTVAMFNPAAVAHVHLGCSHQDLIDTALALVSRDALACVHADLVQCIEALLQLAAQHADTPVLARARLQPAGVTSLGLLCTGWAAPLVRSRQRLQRVAERALCVQLSLQPPAPQGEASAAKPAKPAKAVLPQGGPSDPAQAPAPTLALRERVAAELGLQAPAMAWHTQRDEWVALGCELGLLVGSLGKLARDLSLMAQFEVGELAEAVPGQGGPSAAPAGCTVALAAAARAPQRVAALLAAMPQEHGHALGGWQAELAEWPGLWMSAHGAARAMAQAVAGLQVHAPRMRQNIEAARAGRTDGAASACFDLQHAQGAARLTQAQLATLRQALQHA